MGPSRTAGAMYGRVVILAALAVTGAPVRFATTRKGHGPEDFEWLQVPLRQVCKNRARDLHATDREGNAVTPLFFQILNEEDSCELLMFSRPDAHQSRVVAWWVRSNTDGTGIDLGYQYAPGYFMGKAIQPMISLFEEGKIVGGFKFGIEEVALRDGGVAPRAFVEAVAAQERGGALAERGDIDTSGSCPLGFTCCLSGIGPRSACVRGAACADFWIEDGKADLGTWSSLIAPATRACSSARDGLFSWNGSFENELDAQPSAKEIEKVRAWLAASGVAWAAPQGCEGSSERFMACARNRAKQAGMLETASEPTLSAEGKGQTEQVLRGRDRMYIVVLWVEDSSAWSSCAIGGLVYQRDPQSDEFWRREYKVCTETFEFGGQAVKFHAGAGPLPPREIRILHELKL